MDFGGLSLLFVGIYKTCGLEGVRFSIIGQRGVHQNPSIIVLSVTLVHRRDPLKNESR